MSSMYDPLELLISALTQIHRRLCQAALCKPTCTTPTVMPVVPSIASPLFINIARHDILGHAPNVGHLKFDGRLRTI